MDTPIARSWSFRFYAKTQMGRAFQCPDVSVYYNRWTSHESVPLPPSPLLHPRSIPDTSSFRCFEHTPSTFLDDRGTVSNRAHSRLNGDEYSRTMLVKTKRRPRLYCTYYERKYVLSLSTIVRSTRQRSPTKDRYGWGAKGRLPPRQRERCRLCNCIISVFRRIPR